MREIRFRAWDTRRRTMVYEVEVHSGEQDWWQAYIGTWEVLPASEGILMQYTGLKDKEGQEVYEGDVLLSETYATESNPMAEPDMAVVEFLSGAFGMRYLSYQGLSVRNGRFESFQSLIGDEDTLFEEKVIGNVYQNPELINNGGE